MRLESKVALISGGAPGLGAAEAKLFAREGAGVVIGDVLEEADRQVEAEINEGGGHCVFNRLDVTSEAQWQRAIQATVSRFGRLDRTPLGRLGRPENGAFGALYLASDKSSFVTGSELVIHGGRTAQYPLINHYSFRK